MSRCRSRSSPRARVLAPLATVALLAAGCVRVPDGLEPVTGFEPERYLGTWYEIARLDHSFEEGLTRVRATYGRRDGGGLTVLNEGYDPDEGEWDAARGKAFFVRSPDVGYLKVSFFGPFYGAYVIFELDEDYRHALVSGPNRDYLWLLARDPDLDRATVERLVGIAREKGFPTEALIYVEHE